MEKVNLYINSKNRDYNDKIKHINVSLPNGLLSCNMDEYFILNVKSFILALIGITALVKIIDVNKKQKIMIIL